MSCSHRLRFSEGPDDEGRDWREFGDRHWGSNSTGGSSGVGTGGSAQPGAEFMTVQCDKASVANSMTTVTIGTTTTTSKSISTTYYAQISVNGLNPASPPPVRVIVCSADRVTVSKSNSDAGTSYTTTTTTSHSGDPEPAAACYETLATYAQGTIYIGCGSVTESISGSTDTTTGGYYSQVYVSM